MIPARIYRVGGYMLIVAVVNLAVSLAAVYFPPTSRPRWLGTCGYPFVIGSPCSRTPRPPVRHSQPAHPRHRRRRQCPGVAVRVLAIAVTAPFMLVGATVLVDQGWRLSPVIVVAGTILSVGIGVFIRQLIPAATHPEAHRQPESDRPRTAVGSAGDPGIQPGADRELRRYDEANTDLFTVAYIWVVGRPRCCPLSPSWPASPR